MAHRSNVNFRFIFRIISVVALTVASWTLQVAGASSAEIKIAVAANFTDPVKQISREFEARTQHKLLLSFGATGQFYAQIAQGAPFDILLAADKATPTKAVAETLAVSGTAFTYAIGKLALFSKDSNLVHGETTLKESRFAKIAIANPETAPYGAAAIDVMKKLGVYDALAPKIVQGNNIAQAFQFVDTGNAELGFVALSQIAFVDGGSRWIVPAALHAPIAQDAVLLKMGQDNPAAKDFLEFLKGPEARRIVEKFGYGIGG